MSGKCNGVGAKILELNSSAMYVHCYAHRLNLALVDVSKAIPTIADFFILLEKLYVFVSASTTHVIFIEHQKHTSSKVYELKQISDTRWSCRYSSIKAVFATYSAILGTLVEVSNGTNRERGVEAKGWLLQINPLNLF